MIENQDFHDRFVECFSHSNSVFKVVDSGDHYQRKKDSFAQMSKIRVKSFIEFVGFSETSSGAFLVAVGEFRKKMSMFMDLLNVFVLARKFAFAEFCHLLFLF